MNTSTKAKCEALAKTHNINIQLEHFVGYCYWLTIPEGMIMEDGCTGRTDTDLFMSKAEVWGLIMADLKDILQHDWVEA